ncbi:MAG: insulinase family protein [Planctomycetota bacterium]|jgi:Zn-dependent M16 (insulinase) family peptidase|nr:insulinase family protein [Planctomycetota bacterium]
MDDVAIPADKRYAPGMTLHGFTVSKVTDLPRPGFSAVELLHGKSGARHLHLAAGDRENLFGIAFRTPPPDDTGLPHILEHAVLCGSRRYPVKDSFVELLKSSLATFLNAFTSPDRTVYPCSSMNRRDFHNLMRVYCDSVFFPTLAEDHFRQEGHHLEFSGDGGIFIKGVVYNEMRGIYSDPENILERRVSRELFGGNAYGNDYGGDPKFIPSLTYEQFVAFHHRYYHPSNSWIFTYGDIPLEETLSIIGGEFLSEFDRIPVDTTIAPLPRWTAPRKIGFPYPVEQGEDVAGKTDIAMAFATNDRRDLLVTLAMRLIDGYLLDNSASPLRKALIDSRLGQELGSSGYADHQRDTLFAVTLKGSEADRAQKTEDLVFDVLRREIGNGFDREKVESALHQLELSAREIKSQYPLRLMERVFTAWLYDSDPLSQLNIGDRLDELRERVLNEPGFLEAIAREFLLDNPHRLLAVMTPDPAYSARMEMEAAGKMETLLAGMSDHMKREARVIAKRLEIVQAEGNTPEALATLPRLSLPDVSSEPIPLPYQRHPVGRFELLDVPMYSGGVDYLLLTLDLGYLEGDDLDYLPLFCEALEKSGAAGRGYAEMAALEASVAGGIEFSPGIVASVEGPDRARLGINAWLKALDGNWERALPLLADRLFRPEFDDPDRLRDIVLQSRVAWRNQVAPQGHHFAALYAARHLSPAALLAERLSGCTQARFVDALAAAGDGRVDGLAERFAAMAGKIASLADVSAAQVGSREAFSASEAWLAENAGGFRAGGGRPSPPPHPVPATGERIGLAAPSEIAHVARALPAPALSGADAPALLLLGQQLSYGYLWNAVRVKGGAYGVRASYDYARGTFTFWSYRDPNLTDTLAAYSGAAKFIAKEMDLSPAGLEQAIIGTIKLLDQPVRPSQAAAAALGRHLAGEDETFRKKFRSRLLRLGADDIRGAAERLLSGLENAPVCALASREKIAAENARPDGPSLQTEQLWRTGN